VAPEHRGQVWRELQDWQDGGPSADHPTMSTRRIQFAVGYPPEPVPVLRAPGAPDRLPQITQEAQDYANAIREAAEREAAAITRHATDEAAAIREASLREASESRARLDPMSGKPAARPEPRKRSRQQQAMRIAVCGTAGLLSFAAISGATELGLHGYGFFVFREGGVGQTHGHETDQQFLARTSAATCHEP
jgi:hypothetical protein